MEPGLASDLLISTSVQELTLGFKLRKLYSKSKGLPLFGPRLTDFGNVTKCHTFLWQLWVFQSDRYLFPRTFPVGLFLASIYKMLRDNNIYLKMLHWNIPCCAPPFSILLFKCPQMPLHLCILQAQTHCSASKSHSCLLNKINHPNTFNLRPCYVNPNADIIFALPLDAKTTTYSPVPHLHSRNANSPQLPSYLGSLGLSACWLAILFMHGQMSDESV